MSDLRRLLSRRRSGAALELSVSAAQAVPPITTATTNGDSAQAPPGSVVESKPIVSRSASGSARGSEEVLALVRKVGDHLDHQSARTEKLVGLMNRMPQALDALPEINRQNARLLDVLAEHLDQSKRRETDLNTTLTRLGDAATNHTELLGLVQQQLEVNADSTEQSIQTLGAFREAVADLADSNRSSVKVLLDITRSIKGREARMEASFGRAQRWVIASLLIFGTVAAGAIAIAAQAIAKLSAG